MQTQTFRLMRSSTNLKCHCEPCTTQSAFHWMLSPTPKKYWRLPKKAGDISKCLLHPPLEIRIGVLEGGSSECPPEPVHRQQRNLRACVPDTENFAISDLKQGFAFARFTRATVENRAYLRTVAGCT